MYISIDPFICRPIKLIIGMDSDGCQESQSLNWGHADCVITFNSQNFLTILGQQIKLF
jgi:hypothetical protein